MSHTPARTAACLRVAVLASGRGSNLQALIDARDNAHLPIDIVGVFSDRADAAALDKARAAGIHAESLSPADFAKRREFDAAFFDLVDRVQPGLIVCAGYMRLISAAAVRRHLGRMINIHPSLLPDHPGLDTHARALAAGDTEHGASVHFVTPQLDGGPVMAQVRLPVLPGDDALSLSRRVLAREHALLVQSVRLLAEGRLGFADDAALFDGHALQRPLLLDSSDMLVTQAASAHPLSAAAGARA